MNCSVAPLKLDAEAWCTEIRIVTRIGCPIRTTFWIVYKL